MRLEVISTMFRSLVSITALGRLSMIVDDAASNVGAVDGWQFWRVSNLSQSPIVPWSNGSRNPLFGCLPFLCALKMRLAFRPRLKGQTLYSYRH